MATTNTTEPGTEEPDERLGQSGFAARLKGLGGELACFNAKLVRPTKMSYDRYEVMLKTPGTLVDVELVLPARCFEIVVDLDHRSAQAGGTGMSSVLDSLTTQVAAFIHNQQPGRSVKDVFERVSGGDGQLDKTELYNALKKLDTDVSPQEIGLIWPVFDMDNSGHISYREFLQFCDRAAQKTAGLGLGSGMKAACEALTNKVRTTLNAAASADGKDIMAVFRMFDLNGDMTIDKEEFRFGCQALSINISPKEVDAVWPMFDNDMSGSIDMEEFLATCRNLGHRNNSHRDSRANWTDNLTSTNKAARKERILKATDAAMLLADISLQLREAVNGFLKTEEKTARQLFKEFDIDGSNSIDRNELYERLMERNFDITAPELNIIWPMINDDDDETVSLEEWLAFLNMKNKNWSFSKLKDRILKRLPDNYHEMIRDRARKLLEKQTEEPSTELTKPKFSKPKRPSKPPQFNSVPRKKKENVSSFGRRVIYKELQTDLASHGYHKATGSVMLPVQEEEEEPIKRTVPANTFRPQLEPVKQSEVFEGTATNKERSQRKQLARLPHEVAKEKKELWSVPHGVHNAQTAEPLKNKKKKTKKRAVMQQRPSSILENLMPKSDKLISSTGRKYPEDPFLAEIYRLYDEKQAQYEL